MNEIKWIKVNGRNHVSEQKDERGYHLYRLVKDFSQEWALGVLRDSSDASKTGLNYRYSQYRTTKLAEIKQFAKQVDLTKVGRVVNEI